MRSVSLISSSPSSSPARRSRALNWLVARAALGGRVSRIHSNYHVPISNTASGMMVLEHRS